MRIAGTKSCSFVNGPGVRYVIFMQGCPHHCEGCHNPETWDFDGGRFVTNSDLLLDITPHQHISGITISGGEPFAQEDALEDFLFYLKPIADFKKWDIWLYTGYEYEDIKNSKVLDYVDVLVTGKFEKDKLVTGEWYGSTNQKIIYLKDKKTKRQKERR